MAILKALETDHGVQVSGSLLGFLVENIDHDNICLVEFGRFKWDYRERSLMQKRLTTRNCLSQCATPSSMDIVHFYQSWGLPTSMGRTPLRPWHLGPRNGDVSAPGTELGTSSFIHLLSFSNLSGTGSEGTIFGGWGVPLRLFLALHLAITLRSFKEIIWDAGDPT